MWTCWSCLRETAWASGCCDYYRSSSHKHWRPHLCRSERGEQESTLISLSLSTRADLGPDPTRQTPDPARRRESHDHAHESRRRLVDASRLDALPLAIVGGQLGLVVKLEKRVVLVDELDLGLARLA